MTGQIICVSGVSSLSETRSQNTEKLSVDQAATVLLNFLQQAREGGERSISTCRPYFRTEIWLEWKLKKRKEKIYSLYLYIYLYQSSTLLSKWLTHLYVYCNVIFVRGGSSYGRNGICRGAAWTQFVCIHFICFLLQYLIYITVSVSVCGSKVPTIHLIKSYLVHFCPDMRMLLRSHFKSIMDNYWWDTQYQHISILWGVSSDFEVFSTIWNLNISLWATHFEGL